MVEFSPVLFTLSKIGVGALEHFSKACVRIHGKENIPAGTLIFVANHFTRLETLVLAYELYKLTGKPVMSLADHSLFVGALGRYLDSLGAVSTRDPNRDTILVRALLMGEHPLLVFPEGAMIKDKKIVQRGRFLIYSATGKRRPPHTGAAALALRAAFSRERLRYLQASGSPLLSRQLQVLNLDSMAQVSDREIYLVPVNVSYYPIRTRENILERLATTLAKDLPERLREELQTEGTMLVAGVDMDISIGPPVAVSGYLEDRRIREDICCPQFLEPDAPLGSRRVLRRLAGRLTMEIMAAIYGMTMVNFDHVAAYLLKYSPQRRIYLIDLLEKAYLAAKSLSKDTTIRLHPSLQQVGEQALYRDLPPKLEDFLAVAIKSGVGRRHGHYLQKQRLRRRKWVDFHTVRRDNPYLVILNEVEYLRRLTRRLRRLALKPGWLIRRRLHHHFLRQEQERFHRDYRTFYLEGESKPESVGRPFFLPRSRAKGGVLLLHGYMAAPEEVRPLAEFLHRHGYEVYGARLSGHGTSADDLAGRTWEDWLESAARGYLILANRGRPVIVGGFSMGGALALVLADCQLPGIEAVFAISPPVRVRRASARLAPAVVSMERLAQRVAGRGDKVHFVANEPENPEINYRRNPLTGISELLDLIEELRRRAPRITLPCLLVQGDDDPVVHPEGTRQLYRLLGSTRKELLLVPASRHVVIRGEGAEGIFARILAFTDGIGAER